MIRQTTSRYELLLPIGTGGMATVYVGRALGAVGFKRLVALKKAHSHLRLDPRLSETMKREAHLASRLHHANVVSVLDVEEVGGDLILVLDYVEGCTLRHLMSKLERAGHEARPREIIRILLDAAAGLHAAHRTTDDEGRLLGLVHRDVTPSNVLVGVDGVSRLSDFGIAKVLFENSEKTEAGVLKGKSPYMAPEYVLHQRADAQSDLFSFAVVAWEALAGSALFKGPTEIETLKRVARVEARPLSEERPELAPLDRVFKRALARMPADRHASVEEMASELEAIARTHDLVGSHAEVSALVERLAQPQLDDRRRRLRENTEQIPAIPKTALARDGVPTATVGPIRGSDLDALEARILGDDTEPLEPAPLVRLSGPHEDVGTPSASVRTLSIDAIVPLPAHAEEATPELDPPWVPPPHVPEPVHPPQAMPAAIIAPALHHLPRRRPARRSRSRDALALTGALMLLALVLGWTVTVIRRGLEPEPVVAAPPTSPPAPVPTIEASVAPMASAPPQPQATHPPHAVQPPAPQPSPPSVANRAHVRKPAPAPAASPKTLTPTKAPPNPYEHH